MADRGLEKGEERDTARDRLCVCTRGPPSIPRAPAGSTRSTRTTACLAGTCLLREFMKTVSAVKAWSGGHDVIPGSEDTWTFNRRHEQTQEDQDKASAMRGRLRVDERPARRTPADRLDAQRLTRESLGTNQAVTYACVGRTQVLSCFYSEDVILFLDES